MRKVYYIYNPQTQTYDRIYPTLRQRALSILRRLFYVMGLGAGCFIVLLLIFGSPSEKELRIENSRLLAQYNVLSRRLDDAMGVLQDIQQRDDNLYRVILQADPVSPAIRQAGYGGTNRYEELMDLANAKLVVNTTQKLDVLSKRLYIQSKSFDDVIDMCKNHDEMLKCIPAIQPISNKDLRQTASGYGTRIDPIYGTTKFHAGMDFSAHPGTDVYATGNGTVVKVGWETGYGNTIEIDHGFGYLTRYAHLQGFNTKVGKKVVRGEIIGKVGSTGKSTGPHLHYEVHVKGQVVNPVNYYFMDLSAEDYEKMIQLAANHGKVFDMFGVNPSLLRFWEKEFPQISPKTAGRGIRQYRKEDVETIGLIYHLVKEKGMTLPGARQRLKDNKEATVRNYEIVNKLKAIKEELLAIKRELDGRE